MSWPVGLPMGSVNFGKAAVMQSGVNLPMRVVIDVVLAPDAPSKTLVYRPTGQPLPAITTIFDTDEGTDTHSMALPLCDSPDMGYGNGTAIILDDDHEFTHVYKATIDYLSPDRRTIYSGLRTIKSFVITTDLPTGDIDDMILITGSSASFGVPVFIPDTWDDLISGAGPVTYDRLPAGVEIGVRKTGATWPARPTDRLDLIVHWMGGDDEDDRPSAFEDDVDYWDRPLA